MTTAHFPPVHRNHRDDDHNDGCRYDPMEVTTTASTPKEKKSVRIAEYLNTVRSVDRSNIDEASNLWYTEEEYDQISIQCKILVRMIEHRQQVSPFVSLRRRTKRQVAVPSVLPAVPDPDEYRGLECRTRTGRSLRLHRQRNALFAVLDEQERRYCDFDFDCDADEELARVYAAHAARSAEAALLRAI